MKSYVHKGETLTVVAPYALTSGQGFQVGNLFGVTVNTQNSGDSSEMQVVGVFDLAKDTSTFNSGDLVYFNNTTFNCTSIAEDNLLIGAAELSQASGVNAPGGLSGDATVRVRLNAHFSGTGYLTAVANLTAANLIAMNGTPVNIIPAPGAGMAVVVDSVLFEMTPGTVAFTGGGTSQFNYHGGSTPVHAGTVPASVVTSASSGVQTVTQLGMAVQAIGTTVPANTGVDITNNTAAFAAGNGVAKVQIRYRVVAL